MTTTYYGETVLLDDPFFTGVATSADVPFRMPVAIGGHPYMIDTIEYRRKTIPALRQAADLTVEPGEGSLAIQGTWSRSAKTWWYGAGQLRYDDSSVASGTSNRGQFYQSRNIDPWTNGAVALARQGTSNYTHTLTSPTSKLLTTNAGVYWLLDNVLYLLTGAALATRTVITGTPGSTINDITTDGTSIYLATAGGMYSGVLGGATVAIFGAATATQAIGYANGFLLAGRGRALGTVDAAGAFTALYTHYSTAFLWSQIGSGGDHIYALGGADSFTELYKTSIIETTGALNQPSLATVLPAGEKILCFLAYVNAVVVLGTSKGVRVGAITTEGKVDYGPLISDPGPVSALTPDGDFVWFGWNQIAIPDELAVTTTKPGVGRLDLGRSTASLTPTYTTDFSPNNTTTFDNIVTAITTAIARYNGLTLFAFNYVGGSPGGALVLESPTTYALAGWLNTGWINYGIIEDKVFIDLVIHHSALLTGQSIAVYYITELNPVPTLIGTSSVVGSIESTPLLLNAVRGDRIQLLFKLIGPGTSTPMLSTWWLRAIPTPRRVEEILVPIILTDQFTPGGGDGSLAGMDTLAEFQFIASLAADSIITSYQEGTQTYTVKVSDYELKPGAWNDDNSFFDATFFVTLTTVV